MLIISYVLLVLGILGLISSVINILQLSMSIWIIPMVAVGAISSAGVAYQGQLGVQTLKPAVSALEAFDYS